MLQINANKYHAIVSPGKNGKKTHKIIKTITHIIPIILSFFLLSLIKKMVDTTPPIIDQLIANHIQKKISPGKNG